MAKRAGIEVNEDQVTFDTVELDDGRIRKIPTAEATAEAARLLGNKKLNELMGLKYLDGMVNTFSGRAETPEDLVSLVGIAYNAGPEVAKAWDGNPERLNDETRRYIDRLGDDPDAVSFARIAGGFASDEPEAGSPEAQARVVEAIQRRRAERPARSAEEQLLDMAGDRPMPVVGQGAPRESVSVMPLPRPPAVSLDNTFDPTMAAPNISMPNLPAPLPSEQDIAGARAAYMGVTPPPQPRLDFVTPQEGPREIRESARKGMEMMLDQLDQNDRQRRIEAVPELIKLYQDMGIDPIQASNLALGIGPRGPVNPFGAPPADRSGVATLPVDLGIGPDGPVRYPFGAPASDRSGIAVTGQNVFGTGFGDVRDAVSADPVSDGIVSTRPDIFGTGFGDVRDGDARMQATESAEVQSRPMGRDPFSNPALVEDQLRRRETTGQFFTDLDKELAERRRYDAPISGPAGRNRYVPPPEVPVEKSIQESNAELGIGPTGPASPFGTGGSEAGRFGGLTQPVDANGVTPETQILDTLVDEPSGDRSNPASMDITSPDYDLAEVIARNQRIYDPFKFDLTKGETEPKPTPDVTSPEFDISDILENSRRMNQANILMQLGAGIAAGDVSKGLSAAGAAAASGAKEIRDLDMRSRLAKYQAGREDQKRETAASQFDRQMTLLEEKVRNAAKYGGSATTAALIKVLGDEAQVLRQNLNYINKEEDGGTKYKNALDRLESLQQTIYSLGGIKMTTEGTTGFYDLDLGTVGSSAIVGAGG